MHIFVFLPVLGLVEQSYDCIFVESVIFGLHEFNVGCRVGFYREMMVFEFGEDIFDYFLVIIDKFVDLLFKIVVKYSSFFYVRVHERVFGFPDRF